jgi:hypothetical protein
MASWSEIENEVPQLAAQAREYFDAFTHKTLATIRRDGSPRISGSEVQFRDGDAWLGSMWLAMKARDLRRDPRFALHSGSASPPDWTGDAKIAGRVVEVTDPARVEELNGEAAQGDPSHLFRCDISELVVVRLGESGDHIVIDAWHEGRGVSTLQRR